jgi:hypothetical protein
LQLGQILIAFLLFHFSFVALEAGVLVARAQARLIVLPNYTQHSMARRRSSGEDAHFI